MRTGLLLLILSVLFSPAALAQGDRARAWDLITGAQELIKTGRFEEAQRRLLQARDLDPAYPEVHANLGYLYVTSGDRAQALDAYGQLLTLRPDHEYGRSAFRKLFHEGPFPRVMRAPFMAFSGVAFENDEVRLQTASGELRRRLAYTTSLLFHEDMGRGQGPVAVRLPVTGNALSSPLNRSCYGYVMPPDTDRFSLAFSLSWPSETLSQSGQSYQQLAPRLMHLLLRFYWYARVYLNRDLPDPKLVKSYLCEEGPVGAESYKTSLFFYDVKVPRAPVEWARQAAHEMGHLLLPEYGRFTKPETFASGHLGERLLLQYLALEAGLVAGEPWPAEAARQALAGLWPGQEVQLAEYIKGSCRTSLDYWLAAGPDSPLVAGSGDEAMQYFIGLVLWVQAAHGADVMRQMMQNAIGATPADMVYAYKGEVRKLADERELSWHAGALNLAASRLQTPPREGALRREGVRLSPDDVAVYPVYVTEGAWTLKLDPPVAGVQVTFDGRGPLPLDPASGLSLGRPTEGWHTLQLQLAPQAAPVRLERLLLLAGRET